MFNFCRLSNDYEFHLRFDGFDGTSKYVSNCLTYVSSESAFRAGLDLLDDLVPSNPSFSFDGVVIYLQVFKSRLGGLVLVDESRYTVHNDCIFLV